MKTIKCNFPLAHWERMPIGQVRGRFFIIEMLDSNIESTEPYVVPETLDELAGHYKEVLRLLGEDTEREGLLKTSSCG